MAIRHGRLWSSKAAIRGILTVHQAANFSRLLSTVAVAVTVGLNQSVQALMAFDYSKKGWRVNLRFSRAQIDCRVLKNFIMRDFSLYCYIIRVLSRIREMHNVLRVFQTTQLVKRSDPCCGEVD